MQGKPRALIRVLITDIISSEVVFVERGSIKNCTISEDKKYILRKLSLSEYKEQVRQEKFIIPELGLEAELVETYKV